MVMLLIVITWVAATRFITVGLSGNATTAWPQPFTASITRTAAPLYDPARPHRAFALVVHGRIGKLLGPSRFTSDACLPSKLALTVASASHMEHVVRANAHKGGVDVFVHSWNYGLATAFIDSLYGDALVASMHEPTEHLESGASQALSLGRGVQLVRAHERARGWPYRLVLGARIDLVFAAPVPLRALAPESIWLPTHCCMQKPKGALERSTARKACALNDGRVVAPCRVSAKTWSRPSERGVDLGFFVLDWWAAADSATLGAWLDIGEHWAAYKCQLDARGINNRMGHVTWSVLLHDALNATARVRFTHRVPSALARQLLLHGHAVPPSCMAVRGDPLARTGEELVRELAGWSDPRLAALLGLPDTTFARMATMCPLLPALTEAVEAGRAPPVCCSNGRRDMCTLGGLPPAPSAAACTQRASARMRAFVPAEHRAVLDQNRTRADAARCYDERARRGWISAAQRLQGMPVSEAFVRGRAAMEALRNELESDAAGVPRPFAPRLRFNAACAALRGRGDAEAGMPPPYRAGDLTQSSHCRMQPRDRAHVFSQAINQAAEEQKMRKEAAREANETRACPASDADRAQQI